MKLIAVSISMLLLLLMTVTAGALTGNEWRQADRGLRLLYVTGMWDGLRYGIGLFVRDALGRDVALSTVCGDYSKETPQRTARTVGQIFELVEKWMRDHPERWHEQMPDLVVFALLDACK